MRYDLKMKFNVFLFRNSEMNDSTSTFNCTHITDECQTSKNVTITEGTKIYLERPEDMLDPGAINPGPYRPKYRIQNTEYNIWNMELILS